MNIFTVNIKLYERTPNGITKIEEIKNVPKVDTLIKEALDENLDSCAISIDTERRELFKRFTRVSVEIEDLQNNKKTNNFIVTSDSLIPSATDNRKDAQGNVLGALLYSHDLFLMEPTEWLSGLRLPNLSFKNPITTSDPEKYSNMLDVLESLLRKIRISIINLPIYNSETTFIIDTDTSNLLAKKDFEEITIKAGTTVKDAINQIFQTVNSVLRLDFEDIANSLNLVIKADNYNIRGKKVNFVDEDILNYEAENRIGDYSNSIVSDIKNAVIVYNDTEKHKFPRATADFLRKTDGANFGSGIGARSFQTVINADAAEIVVPGGGRIRRINKIILTAIDTDNIYNSTPADITSYVLEKGQWAQLDTEGFTSGQTKVQKQNCFIYDKGGRSIYNIGRTTRSGFLLWSDTVLNEVAESAGLTNVSLSFDEFAVYIEYEPYEDLRLEIENDIVDDQVYDYAQYSNQAENIIDIRRYGKNLYGQVIRLGNEELTFKQDIILVTDILKSGDYIKNYDAIVTNVTLNVNNGQIIAEYLAIRNFNRIDDKISVNKQVRQGNVPLGEESTLRNDVIHQYIISTASDRFYNLPEFKGIYGKNEDNYGQSPLLRNNTDLGTFWGLTKQGVDEMFAPFIKSSQDISNSESIKIINTIVKTDSDEPSADVNGGNRYNIVNTKSIGLKNTLAFFFRMNDAVNVDDKSNVEANGILAETRVLSGSPYAKTGICDRMQLFYGVHIGNPDFSLNTQVAFYQNEFQYVMHSMPFINTRDLNRDKKFLIGLGSVSLNSDRLNEPFPPNNSEPAATRNVWDFRVSESFTQGIEVDKDFGEIYALTLQENILTPRIDDGGNKDYEVVWGDKFTEINKLVGGLDIGPLRVHETPTKYTNDDALFIKDNSDLKKTYTASEVPMTINYDFTNSVATLSLENVSELNLTQGYAWSLSYNRDGKDYLLVAVNPKQAGVPITKIDNWFTLFKPNKIYGI